MKKVLLALAILGFVACNNEGEKTEGADTTVVVPVDTAVVVDTTVVVPVDTTKVDTTKK